MRLNDAFGTGQMGGFVAATSTDAAGINRSSAGRVAVGRSAVTRDGSLGTMNAGAVSRHQRELSTESLSASLN